MYTLTSGWNGRFKLLIWRIRWWYPASVFVVYIIARTCSRWPDRDCGELRWNWQILAFPMLLIRHLPLRPYCLALTLSVIVCCFTVGPHISQTHPWFLHKLILPPPLYSSTVIIGTVLYISVDLEPTLRLWLPARLLSSTCSSSGKYSPMISLSIQNYWKSFIKVDLESSLVIIMDLRGMWYTDPLICMIDCFLLMESKKMRKGYMQNAVCSESPLCCPQCKRVHVCHHILPRKTDSRALHRCEKLRLLWWERNCYSSFFIGKLFLLI